MKINNDYPKEDSRDFNKIDNNLKDKNINKLLSNKLIFIAFLIIFFFNNLKVKIYIEKIKNLENSINGIVKNLTKTEILLNHKSFILNQQFEAILSYLYNIKNSSSIYQILKPKTILGKNKIRIGSNKDGGYVLLNDFENIKFAYSFGINNEISFDKDLADRHIDIFMYDHTIENLPFQNKRFHWKKIGLTEKIGKENNKKTLRELIEENGHTNEKNMILKIDIEGEEWNVFQDIRTDILNKFKYIIAEFHFINESKNDYLKILKKINTSHQIFHLHCNNGGDLIYFENNIICSALEISFIIKENNKFIETKDFYPIKHIDYKNNNDKIDINLFLNMYQIDNLLQFNNNNLE